MERRAFITLLGGSAVAWPLAVSRADAQSANLMPKLSIFSPSEPEALMQENGDSRYYSALFAELRRLGRVVGTNLSVARYGKERSSAGAKAVAAEVIADRPDCIYVVGPGALLFKEATDTIPIVALTGDPVRQGLVKTLAHPGGNITGVSVDAGPSIHGKRTALLREMCPRAKKLAFMTFRGLWERQGEEVRAIAQTLGIDVVGYPLDLPANETVYRDTIAMAKVDGADAIMVGDNPDAMNNRVLIAKLIDATGLPAIYPFAEFVSAGGLMAYSFDLIELNKRVADDIAVILNGTNPGDIPFYQAVKFELSLNLKTARALSLDVPATLMAAANEVIE